MLYPTYVCCYKGKETLDLSRPLRMEIRLEIDEMLKERGRSAYWLAKQTGIAQSSLARMRHQKTQGIQWDTLMRLCAALDCAPGDLITISGKKVRPGKTHAGG